MTITEQEERADVLPLGPDPAADGNPARVVQLLVGVVLGLPASLSCWAGATCFSSS